MISIRPVAFIKPRFASRLVLTPIQLPHLKKDAHDVFLVDPARNDMTEHNNGMGLVLSPNATAEYPKPATWITLPEQKEVEKGQIFQLRRRWTMTRTKRERLGVVSRKTRKTSGKNVKNRPPYRIFCPAET